MRKNIAAVIAAFQAGRAHREATCSTDGVRIYSYAMPIAYRRDDGVTFIVARRSALSVTTKSQVNACWLAMPDGVSIPAPVPRPSVP